MPKQLYKITQFHGGLNSNSDARDIAESELSEATDVMVDELGKIRMMGGIAQHYNYTNSANNPNNAAVINPGYGLFQFSHDRLGGSTTGSAQAETGDDYLAMADEATAQIDIYSRVTNAWVANRFDLGSTHTGMKAAFYVADGSLRVSDGNFGANNETMWYGYIYRRFFGDGSAGYDGTGYTNGLLIDKWHVDEAAPKALPIHSIGGTGSAAMTLTDSYPLFLDIDATPSGEQWWVDLRTNGADTINALTTHHAMATVVTWGTANRIQRHSTDGSANPGYDNFCEAGDTIYVRYAAVAANNRTFTVTAVAATYIDVAETTDTTSADDDVYIYNFSRSEWFDSDNQGWEFGATTLYDDKQESAISKWELTGTHTGGDGEATVMTDSATKSNGQAGFGSTTYIGFVIKNITDGSEGVITASGTDTIEVTELTGGTNNDWDTDDVYSISVMRLGAVVVGSQTAKELRMEVGLFAGDGSATGLSIINPRVSGFKVYMRRENTNTWYLQTDIDVTRGIKWYGKGEAYKMWYNAAGFTESGRVAGEFLSAPRQIETYESETGRSADYTSTGFDGTGTGFKTAVIANRMAYVGNVKIKDKQGNTAVHGDAVLKSSVNKFDSFTLDRIIEASVNDGDNIVKLEAYADRLLIFKKNKLELVNISQEVEFLEDIFMHKGVSHPAATCKTDFGIAWVNKQGCYLYDGQKISNLLEKQGRQIIKESLWATFTANEPIIGYIPKKRQILVADDNSATGTGKIFLYDIVTQSWVKGADGTITSNELTNFVTDWNGDLIYAHTDGAGTVVKWDDAGDDSTAFVIQTKDIDFGQPAQKKKIYKVYVTYTGVSSLSVNVDYQINGDNGWNGFSSGEPLTASSGQNEATLTLSTPVECYSFQLRFSGTGKTTFEINDATIVFRLKGQR